MELTIRPECATDYIVVSDLLNSVFPENNCAEFVCNLRRSSDYFDPAMSLVAEANDGIIVGYMLLFPLKYSERRILALHPIAVIKEVQRRGVGKRLIKEGLKIAKSRGYGGIVVVGHGEYYRKRGFRAAEEWGLFPNVMGPGMEFLAYEFEPLGLSSGLVKYPKEFKGFKSFEFVSM